MRSFTLHSILLVEAVIAFDLGAEGVVFADELADELVLVGFKKSNRCRAFSAWL
jgi:hypothetical protein